MSDLNKSNSGLLATILLSAVLVCASVLAGEAVPEDSPVMGELHIDGSSVTRLTLEDEQNKRNHFSTSEAAITLAPGKYRPVEVALEGGYTCRPHLMPPEMWQWMTVAPGQIVTLKVGAPLRQVVRVERRARSMILNYELRGRGGERYVPDNTSEPPTFAVYRSERKVGSGDFAYG